MRRGKATKKPVTIHFCAFDGTKESGDILVAWSGGAVKWMSSCQLKIDTLEGSLYVSAGDIVIKGIKGEYYPCKPDIFAQTYNEVVQ